MLGEGRRVLLSPSPPLLPSPEYLSMIKRNAVEILGYRSKL